MYEYILMDKNGNTRITEDDQAWREEGLIMVIRTWVTMGYSIEYKKLNHDGEWILMEIKDTQEEV